MKKYLMTGVAAIALCAAFTSCSKGGEDLYNPNAEQEQLQLSYEQAFVQVFGQPSSAQDWGFGTATRGLTRGENANANLWYQTYNVPANVTENEKKLVKDYFTDNLFENKRRINNIDFKDFFIYQVYKGEEHYTANNNGDVLGSDKMNHLQTYVGGTMDEYDNSTETEEHIYYPGTTDIKGSLRREHMNNFNCGNNENVVYWDEKPKTDEYKIVGAMLMVNSGTADFSYNNSEDSKYHNTYVIIPGETIHASLKGFWYVGFDFFGDGANPNQQINRDWQFNDWIVRISPATKIGEETPPEDPNYTIRVIGEDLTIGENPDADFDFNDVVFDVALNVPNKTYIKLKAAGGTLPLIIGVDNPSNDQNYDANEVHKIFGVGTSTMVNTNATAKNLNGRENVEDKILVLDVAYDNAKDIPVYVKKNGKWAQLKAEQGEPASKIGVDTSYQWCDERVSMKENYPRFTQWVTSVNPSYLRWY